MSFKKELEAEALKEYHRVLKSIPKKIWYQDTGQKVRELWESKGQGRKSKQDTTLTFPRYIFLFLGPFDRMGVEVNFFIEEIEEKFGLQFRDAEIGEKGPFYRYGNNWNTILQIFFMVHQRNSCHIVQKEAAPTVLKNYEHQLVCDE